MSDIKFSIIVTTNRGIKELEPLFVNTDPTSELIITDANYNKNTRKWLESQDGYDQIVYAPIEKGPFKYTKDCILGMNMAFTYADNFWLFRADDNLEFKDDAFNKAREGIQYYKDALGNEKFSIIGLKIWEINGGKRWIGGETIPNRFTEITDPEFTCSFGPLPISMVYDMNGYDEIYDYGWGMEEQDFMLRSIVRGWKFFFDKEMMGFSHAHSPNTESTHLNRFIYNLQRPQILAGKTQAFNAYNMKLSHNSNLVIKQKYIV